MRCPGLLTGFAGVLYAAENHQGNPNAGVAYELDAIAAVVIGGASLAGGSGSIGGTVIGTLIMGILTNILRLKNVDSNVEMMVKAVIIVLAVAIQKSGKKDVTMRLPGVWRLAAAVSACRLRRHEAGGEEAVSGGVQPVQQCRAVSRRAECADDEAVRRTARCGSGHLPTRSRITANR